MSKLDDLIKEKCPNEVKVYTLGELGTFYGGLTGKSKNDFVDGNAKFITYKNVYSNPALCLDVEDKVKIADGEKQRTLEYGDIIFTGSSETPDECGFSSVVTTKTNEKLYLNSFCFFFRLNNPGILLPDFAKHLFRSDNLRYQIGKTASGVTRFNVSKERMKSVKIPVPPLEIQNEIVQILDNFAELTAELTAELSNRKKQYEYYRDLLLNFDENEQRERERVEWFTLADVCMKISSGGTPNRSRSDYYGGSIPWVRTQEVDFCNIEDVEMSITDEGLKNSSAKWIPENCVIVAMYGATAGKSAINKIPVTTNQACCNLQVNEEIAMYKYVYYWVCREYENLKALGQGSQNNINAGVIKSYKIPIPSLEHQKYIVDMLDRFNVLTNDISEGLPAEIEAREKQYAYYRDKLLSFKEQKVGAINA
mgnify:CR=1 FL=1